MRTKFRMIVTFAVMLWVQFSFAQQRTVSGTVSDDKGMPLAGVSVQVKNTKNGTQTDFDGKYSISAAAKEVLVFSFVGMQTKEVVAASTSLNVSMQEDARQLDEVVVTALGIKRESKALGYSAQQVSGAQLETVKRENAFSSLSGKVAGLQIKNNNNFGGSTNIVLRGNKTIGNGNQALIVVDGIPLDNNNSNTSRQLAGSTGYDYGNAANDVNANDIESINVLKGAAATALYGSRGSNGVILVKTKSGKKREGLGITVNSGVSFGSIDKKTFAEYQNKYGAGYAPGSFEQHDIDGDSNLDNVVVTYDDASYGDAFDPSLMVYHWDSFVPESSNYNKKHPWVAGANTPVDFFENSHNVNTSIDFAGATDNSTYRVGFTRTEGTYVLPNSEMKKHNLSFNGSHNFTDKLRSSITFNYVNQYTKGRNSTGYNDNLMTQFRQWWQVNVDVEQQKNLFHQTGRNVTWNMNAPWDGDYSPIYWDNPYWTRYKNYQDDTRDRFFGNILMEYDINSWLKATGRLTLDSYAEIQEERREVGSVPALLGLSTDDQPSGYSRYNRNHRELNYDLFLNANKDITENLNLFATVGLNIRRQRTESLRASTIGGLKVPGLFALSNSKSSVPTPLEYLGRKQVNGYFATLSLGYNDMLFGEFSGRSDESSALPENNRRYEYYSASSSFVFSKLMNFNWLDFGKIRLGYAEVGADTNPYNVYDIYQSNDNFIDDANLYTVPSAKANSNLKPELTKSFEFGTELKLFKNRVGLDFTWYKSNTFDQLVNTQVSIPSGYGTKWVNAGNVENKGIELSLNLVPIKTENFEWTTTVNFNQNESLVKELYTNPVTGEPLTNVTLANFGGVTANAMVGQPFGVLKGTGYQYLNGQKVVNASGYYVAVADQVIGDPNPDWIGGINNTFRYKNLTLGFLIDMQQGGDVYSLDMHYGQGTGVLAHTAGLNHLGNPIRNAVSQGGGILFEGVKADGTPNTTVAPATNYGQAYYWGNAVRNPSQMTVYDASFIKLREAFITYNFPKKLIGKYLQGLTLSAVGSNLWIIDKNMPYADPESGLSSGNAQGFLSGSYPTVRNIGFNIKIDF